MISERINNRQFENESTPTKSVLENKGGHIATSFLKCSREECLKERSFIDRNISSHCCLYELHYRKIEIESHPKYSSDLAPCDFSVFLYI